MIPPYGSPSLEMHNASVIFDGRLREVPIEHRKLVAAALRDLATAMGDADPIRSEGLRDAAMLITQASRFEEALIRVEPA